MYPYNTQMNWKNLSGVALAILVGCIWALLFRRSLFGTGPVTIALQFAAALLMLWARYTFGMRSFHGTANPTSGGLVTNGPYRVLPRSHLRLDSVLPRRGTEPLTFR